MTEKVREGNEAESEDLPVERTYRLLRTKEGYVPRTETLRPAVGSALCVRHTGHVWTKIRRVLFSMRRVRAFPLIA